MSTAVSIYSYDHTPSGQSRLYKRRKFSVHGTVSYVLFQNIPGYDVLLLYTMDRCLPPSTYACQRVTKLSKLAVYVYYRSTETTGMLYILKLVCLLLKYKRNGMLNILKLVCLLQK